MAIAEGTGNDILWACAAPLKGWFMAESGRPAEGIELPDAAWQVADRANHVTAAFFAAWIGSGMSWNLRDLASAITKLRRELETERSRQNLEQRGILIHWLTTMLAQLGDLEAARGLEPEVPTGATFFFARAWLAYAAGDWERAASIVVEGDRDAKARGNSNSRWGALYILGLARLALGDLAGARVALDQGIVVCVEGGSAMGKSWIAPALARVCLDAAEVARALELIELAHSAFESIETAGAISSRFAEVEAEIALAQGDEVRARQLFTASIAAYGPYPEPWSEGEFRLRWSRKLRSLGDRAGAGEQIEAAHQIYTRIGAGPAWIDRLERSRAPGEPHQ